MSWRSLGPSVALQSARSWYNCWKALDLGLQLTFLKDFPDLPLGMAKEWIHVHAQCTHREDWLLGDN